MDVKMQALFGERLSQIHKVVRVDIADKEYRALQAYAGHHDPHHIATVLVVMHLGKRAVLKPGVLTHVVKVVYDTDYSVFAPPTGTSVNTYLRRSLVAGLLDAASQTKTEHGTANKIWRFLD